VTFRNPCIAYTPLAIANALMLDSEAQWDDGWNGIEWNGAESGGEHYKASLRT